MSPRPLLAFLLLIPSLALAQNPGLGDWGDAPEGALAYPSLGVAGLFPTCFGGPAGYIWHAPNPDAFNMYFGFSADHELDGNAGFCPAPPYERDECWGPFDGDGGLAIPDPFTIDNGNQVVPCGQQPPASLGTVCSTITLSVGGPFEANIVNNTNLPGFVNVIFDWNQDGRWGGGAQCAVGGMVPEHAIVNLPVPPFYVGPLSGLNPGPITIGPNPGYVWVRMTISPVQGVLADWDGSGIFDGGETEDYLLRIDDNPDDVGELGDAPEDALAYPNGVMGAFPTCIATGPAGFIFHSAPTTAFFGPLADTEFEGNAGFCPQPPYDQDECGVNDGDAGILFPDPWTLDPGGNPVRCTAGTRDRWQVCRTASWGLHTDIELTNNSPDVRYLNVLVDWDQDGRWTNALQTCPNGNVVEEHVLVDFRIPPGFSGQLSQLSPPDFNLGAAPDWVWARFSLTDAKVGQGWDGSGHFGDGETEDYLFRLDDQPTGLPGIPDLDGALRLHGATPNPFNPRTTVAFTAARDGIVRLTLHDASGRRVRTLVDGAVTAGRNEVSWNGTDDDGRSLPSGVYFARASMDGTVETAKLVLVR